MFSVNISFAEDCPTIKKGDGVKKINAALKCIDDKVENIQKPFYGYDIKKTSASDCKTSKIALGSIDDYVFWSLLGQTIYRDGCDMGELGCQIELEGKIWVLIAYGGSGKSCKDTSCGAAIVKCRAIGLKK